MAKAYNPYSVDGCYEDDEDTPRKMKVDDNPFPGDQNMVDAGLFKGKTKVLTSIKSKEAGTVDPKMQISADKYKEIKRRHDEQKSRYE